MTDYENANKSDNWCSEFVSYAMINSGYGNKLPSAYIDSVLGSQKAKEFAENKQGEWHDATENYQPKRGDIFYNKNHTGIVVASDDEYIYTIEGNTANDDGMYYIKDAELGNSESNTEGGYVNTRVRKKGEYVDIGFYTPDNKDNLISDKKIEESLTPNFSEEYKNKKIATEKLFEQHQKETGH